MVAGVVVKIAVAAPYVSMIMTVVVVTKVATKF